MIALLLILIPVIGGLISLFIKNENTAKAFSLIVSLIVFAFALSGICATQADLLHYDASWIPDLGSRITLGLDGLSKILSLLTAISMPVILIAVYKDHYPNAGKFFGLMLLCQAGMLGVFLSMDALLFYFFWELALIPAYFICSIWGGEKRIQVTFKFFIYTFVGSLLMLVSILFVYFHTPDHSFALKSFYHANLTATQTQWMFWLFFIALAIKMPVFPFHTWQPDTYEQSPTAFTMVLSGVMVKMGLFAVIRWLLPVFPQASSFNSSIIIILSVTGILYASLIAIKQDDMKRLIAYSSIAHIGLMCAALFAKQQSGMQGAVIQMFNHGVNIIGLWIVADVIEKQLGTRKFSELGGLAQKAPTLAILFVVMCLANVALPLTNAFAGEFLMFNGLFRYNPVMAGVAGISIILAAVYTLSMIRKIFYGNTVALTEQAHDSSFNVNAALAILAALVFVFGFYPQPIINLTNTVTVFITK
ncbi:complex I subunit 4 family protein [Parafilimonas sp.]|uniref:complex I subunit 4 family protein n=1 Tax=Parafilimonas sp. TaxID=1969739 RepID=UPI0039E5247F